MIAMSPKDRRTLAVGVLMIGSIIAVGRGIPWWRDWDTDQRVRAAIVLARVADFDKAIKALPVMADSARRTAVLYGTASQSLLVEETPTIASAKLTQIVAAVADDADVRITSLQVRPDTAFRDRFARVAVRLTGTGDIQSLVSLLAGFDEQDTLLSVKELSVTPAEATAPDTKPEALRIQVLVEALALEATPKTQQPRPTK
jgi:hypothetical protein